MIDLPWDPEFDSPATLAIVGAGPIGIEAAIYARFLGYFVSIFDTRRVAHRMLDWNHRKLSVPVSLCTSSLGHAAIKSQNPEYVLPSPDTVWSGKEYAESYLLPLAKTDLLFDDIHFLSPVSSISRLRTHLNTGVEPQTRCEDEFRLVVEGQHRGTWISRADIVFDCRGIYEETAGMGPGGGLAIGELSARPELYRFTPEHRKFEEKQLAGKNLCVVGNSHNACLLVEEYLRWYAEKAHGCTESRLMWILNEDPLVASPQQSALLKAIDADTSGQLQSYFSLGIEKVTKRDDGKWELLLLQEDDSKVELECDLLASYPARRTAVALGEVASHESAIPDNSEWSFVTKEPGYYRLNGGALDWTDESSGEEGKQTGAWNAGAGIAAGLEQIKKAFQLIVERDTLDLYQVMEENLQKGRV